MNGSEKIILGEVSKTQKDKYDKYIAHPSSEKLPPEADEN